MTEHASHHDHPVVEYVVAGLGVLLMIGTLPFFLASGLMAPMWAVIALLLVWLVLITLAVRWFRTRPYVVLGLPFLAAAVWFAAMYAGEAFLGWSA